MTEATPIATDASGIYHVNVEFGNGATHRYAVSAADADDAANYVQLVCLPVDYPREPFAIIGTRLVRPVQS